MEAPQYVAARVKSALAEDERISELGILVDIRGEQLFLRGQVADARRRALIADVAEEAAPGLTVRNEITVLDVRDPCEEEKL
ncbi:MULTISPECIES: BON domain-containing protein [Streptosporangium]|jgi:osmotically-inducible protein OsmY|uniref:BON domain-containing protein n=1 Tax=Streptosporangium subroseum TaxID=106412 RepID=A0A239I5G8_9ACTN|nr:MULTISPECIES: BON domain-containing protein [Streptosporangium]AWS46246.1 BON domain-containing protein [Streptosporangium sp. 'caverna']SNS88741.1 BON domain-containing protein [Streptosporangium subroseum]